MAQFLGIDSSTQSLSMLVFDSSSGSVVGEASVNFGRDLPAYGSPSGFVGSGHQ